MARTDLDIVNLALSRIGEKEFITAGGADDFTDDTLVAEVTNKVYQLTRDRVLEALAWPFATKHAQLAQVTLSPARSGWQFAYATPTDYLIAQYISDGMAPGAAAPSSSAAAYDTWIDAMGEAPLRVAGTPVPFARELSDDGAGEVILTNMSPCELVYTAQVTKPGAFSPGFVNCFAWALASEFALAIPVKAQLADWADKHYQAALLEAGSAQFRGQQVGAQPDSATITSRL